MKFEKADFVQVHGFYYVGHISQHGEEWVDEEQLELILMELNAGVTDGGFAMAISDRKEVIWVPLFSSETNFIHLN